MISQATAPTPAFASVREFDEALGYYERPNREASLQALYERAAAAPATTADRGRHRRARAAAAGTEKATEATQATRSERRQRRLAIAAVGLILIAEDSRNVRNLGAESEQVSEMAAKAGDVVGSAVVSGLSKVTETVGLGRLVSESEANATPAAPVLTPTQMPVAASGRRVRVSHCLRRLSRSSSTTSTSNRRWCHLPVGKRRQSAPAVTDAAVPTSNGGPETDTFTPADTDVVPPIGIRPQLPVSCRATSGPNN